MDHAPVRFVVEVTNKLMRLLSGYHRRLLTAFLIAGSVLAMPILGGGCGCGSPAHSPADYSTIVSTFTIGSIALQTDDPKHRPEFLVRMTKLAPEEPAGWANLGLHYYRANDLAKASEYLNKARELAPPNAGIEKLLGLLAGRSGDQKGAIDHYRKAVQLAPDDLRARYALAQLLENLGTPEGLAGYQTAIQGILDIQPYNLVAQAGLARIAAKRGDNETLKKAVALLDARSSTFNSAAIARLKTVKAEAAAGNWRSAALNVQFLSNTVRENSAYQIGSNALTTPQNDPLGEPILQFLVLPPIPAVPAAPDMGLAFEPAPLLPAGTSKVGWAGAFYKDSEGARALAVADGREVRFDKGPPLPFPGGAGATPPGPFGVLAIDTNYDLRNDLIFAGSGGLKFYEQTQDGGFKDVTTQTKLPAPILGAAYTGVWALDVEADGDLDVALGCAAGLPTVLRNSVDSTWTVVHPFAGVSGLLDFVWADLDGDASMDASLIDGQGKLHVFANQRAGLFQERPLPASIGKTAAIAAGDIDGDGKTDLIVLQADGAILRISDKDHGKSFDVAEVARWNAVPADLAPGTARLLLADLDNNGATDLITSTPTAAKVWLCGEKYEFAALSAPISAGVFAVADIDGKGRIDLIGLSSKGEPVRLANKGVKAYNWQEIRPRAHQQDVGSHIRQLSEFKSGTPSSSGDRRVNSFGVGGELEARAGLLYQKVVIDSPFVHIGLGTYKEIDAVRVLWPNGDVRSEFSHLSDTPLVPNSSVSMLHRPKGSCPWVFAWNGREMVFVTDFLWRSPVGLRINAQDTAGIVQTEDWIKIAGDQLVPRGGYYDIRITAELWETHFFDYVRLMTVDHPIGTEVFVDERFSIPPPPLEIHTLTPPVPVSLAVDDNGTDVTEIVRARDGNYLDTFGRGEYQGITRDHYVEFEVDADTPRTGPLYLVASGWIHPTDSSINVAISQGKHDPPRGLSLEVQDESGAWHTAKSGLGFPAGKNKTIQIRLDDAMIGTASIPKSKIQTPIGHPKSKIHFRLRTNLEIFWDSLAVASEVSGVKPVTQRIGMQSAELRYRGFSAHSQANLSSPDLPDYQNLDGSSHQWNDLIGYCTRFGDVKELLDKVDDRYVIMNAGDEMALQFRVPPSPPRGWKRDFVLIGDGWEKDGDLNTAYSKTILPLPYHGQKSYNTPPGRLEDDPVVRRYPKDWQTYHTRYIMPDGFKSALRPGKQ